MKKLHFEYWNVNTVYYLLLNESPIMHLKDPFRSPNPKMEATALNDVWTFLKQTW